jgi:hypothetical protein
VGTCGNEWVVVEVRCRGGGGGFLAAVFDVGRIMEARMPFVG